MHISSLFLKKIDLIAEQIKERIQKEGNGKFNQICEDTLLENECYKDFSPDLFSKLQLGSVSSFRSPFHNPHDFSDLTFTLYRDEIFHIDIYLWSQVDTVIHDHHVSGAFQCLYGESEQYIYQFDEKREIHSQLAEGKLGLVSSNTITPGMVQIINNGPSFIHNIIHKPPMVMTLFVRSHSLGENGKRCLRNYYYPGYSHELDKHLRAHWLNSFLYHEILVREKKIKLDVWKNSLKNLSDVDLTNLCLIINPSLETDFSLETTLELKKETLKRWNIDWPQTILNNHKRLIQMRALNVY